MKNHYKFLESVVIILAITTIVMAQIPNSGFEDWDEFNNPLFWSTSNIPGYLENISKSDDAHSGNYALRGEVIPFIGTDINWPPFVVANDTSGFSLDQKFNALNGYYKFSPQGGDILFIIVVMYSDVSGGVGAGQLMLTATSDSYMPFSIPIVYISDDPVTNCQIEIFVGDTTEAGTGGTNGTYFLIDDFFFSGVNALSHDESPAVEENFILKPNYPNPFNPSTTIEFTLPQASQVSLTIFDVQGREVARLIDNEWMNAAQHRINWHAADWPSGVYFSRLRAGNHFQSRHMLLIK